jgi:hypothetical protein
MSSPAAGQYVDLLQAVDAEHLVDLPRPENLVVRRAQRIADAEPVLNHVRRIGDLLLDELERALQLGRLHIAPDGCHFFAELRRRILRECRSTHGHTDKRKCNGERGARGRGLQHPNLPSQTLVL